MRVGIIQSVDVNAGGRRLNGGYYLSEDEEAMRLLRHSKAHFMPISDLVVEGGVFTGGIFKLLEAQDGTCGKPYVSAKDLVQSDISSGRFISQKHGRLLDRLELKGGMILVTCSGMNLGKVIWTRQDMDGLCASGDLIRVIADPKSVPSGLLYAYLSSRFGWASIRKLIYGGHIKHIEPKAVSQILVPRLDPEVESRVDALVRQSSSSRTDALRTLEEQRRRLDELHNLGGNDIWGVESAHPKSYFVQANQVRASRRLEATYYDPVVLKIEKAIVKQPHTRLSAVCNVVKPGMFKRIKVEDERFGYGFVTGSELFSIAPKPAYFVSPKTPNIEECVLQPGWILIQAFGQIGGLIGRCTLVTRSLEGCAATDLQIQLRFEQATDAGYAFALLSTRAGQKLLTRIPIGGSIPHIHPEDVRSLVLPWADDETRTSVGQAVIEAWTLRDDAARMEDEARRLVEQAVEDTV